MAGNIAKFLRNAPTDEILDVGRRIGALSMNEGKTNPRFFKTGRTAAPASTLDEIRSRYGVTVTRDKSGKLVFHDDLTGKSADVGVRKGRQLLDDEMEWDGLKHAGGLIAPESDYFSIYSGRLERGSGAGGRIYPAVWDSVYSRQTPITRYTDLMTGDNATRGALNELSAYIRHGDKALMIPNPKQYSLSHLPQELVVSLTPEGQIGTRLTEAAAGIEDKLSAGTALAGDRSVRLVDIVRDVLRGGSPEADRWVGVGGMKMGGLVSIGNSLIRDPPVASRGRDTANRSTQPSQPSHRNY